MTTQKIVLDLSIRKPLGHSGLSVAPVAFGCWGLSEGWRIKRNATEIQSLLSLAWELGINLFDTAGVYGNGLGEEMFRSLSWRHCAVVATKVSAVEKPSYPIKPIQDYYPKSYVQAQLEGSLRRLGRDQIDLFQLHNWYREWECDYLYILDVFHSLKNQGKIRAAGVSLPYWANCDVTCLLETGVIDAIQVPFNLFQQWPRQRIFKSAAHYGAAVLLRSALDHGLLSDLPERYDDLVHDFRKDYLGGGRVDQLRQRISDICDTVGISKDLLPSYSIAFCLSQPEATSTIIGMTTPQQIAANLSVANYTFDQPQLRCASQFDWPRGW